MILAVEDRDVGYLVLPAAMLAHCAEELPRFPAWVTRRMGTHTTRFYLASHALLLPLVMVVGVLPHRSPGKPLARDLAAVSASGFLANAAFHVLATLRWREYSPGVASATTLVAPAALATLRRTHRDGLRGRRLAGAVVAGNLLNGIAVGILFMDMPRLDGQGYPRNWAASPQPPWDRALPGG